MKDNGVRLKFCELRAKGMSYDKISKELNTAKNTLIKWARSSGHEIENFRALEYDEVIETHRMAKLFRLQVLGKTFETMRIELEKRDFSDVPSDKLVISFLKLVDALKMEMPELTFQGDEIEVDFPTLDLGHRPSWPG